MPKLSMEDQLEALARCMQAANKKLPKPRVALIKKRAAAIAAERGLEGLSYRNLNNYMYADRPGHAKTMPTEELFEAIVDVFDGDVEEWRRRCGLSGSGTVKWFYNRDEVLGEQGSLLEGDEVWIVSCRQFEEVSSEEIERVVKGRLASGVCYKYFYPNQDSTAFGAEAATSYRDFKDSLQGFSRTPRIYGFPVDPDKFPYFSRLHTLVYYHKKSAGRSAWKRMYVFIEYEPPAGSRDRQKRVTWYRMPHDDMSRVLMSLKQARAPIGDLNLQYRRTNPKLGQISLKYVDYFSRPDRAQNYCLVRGVVNHASNCVRAILSKFCVAPALQDPGEKPIKYLDIGSGDGDITSKIVDGLGEKPVQLTLLEPSDFEMGKALEKLKAINPSPKTDRFEDADLDNNSFDLISSIHSFYVVDEAYLRRIYEKLSPGGVACIWIGALANNVMNQICHSMDDLLEAGQRRNYAEDVLSTLEDMGLRERGLLDHETYPITIPPLVDGGKLNDSGRSIVAFFAMGRIDPKRVDEASAAAEKIASEVASWDDGKISGHPITDYLITFQKEGAT